MRMMWPECPAFISPDAIVVKCAHAIHPAGSNYVSA